MVFLKNFTLLVATGTTPFFAVVSIICDIHCSCVVMKTYLCLIASNTTNTINKKKNGFYVDFSHNLIPRTLNRLGRTGLKSQLTG